ncbi:peptidyl-tRNA hydrolase PTRHD1 [Plasmodium brasilianum]|uniref:peptidyl-tRNA hydrolase n=2 Tax=Plasmodium (Plasmodium) TaxID=418103 RepID=A0A1C3KZU4_PLAMA|nr:peptidyl-tRNA hydrolase PTRHD1, putative [Plasmodium malariae]KAI4837385.1 peptidyl-tRNA hydrolase PTRHD1 [Plasmodium brasilianum]SBT79801.1 peptidyl-tRNA hydrolase PTRHD1, putative [Plasmodium malariae]SCO93272.1 peptidyl-tRNA hydrolase PTRHD1, putative [Plasmodium malariae]
MQENTIVQYILINKEILDKKWPLGSIIAQACHACIAVIAENIDDQIVKEYISAEKINNMHKIILKVDDSNELKKLSSVLDKESLKYKIWIEYPENVLSAVAIKPYYKDTVKDYFKKYQLLRKL